MGEPTTHKDASTSGKHNSTDWTLHNNLHNAASRPDWLLYMVPAFAFVLGVLLFTFVCKTQQPKKRVVKRLVSTKTNTNPTSHTYLRAVKPSSKLQNSSKSQENVSKNLSYENVSTVIYSNEKKVTYCLLQDGDYITPDAMGTEKTEPEPDPNYLQPSQILTDTDGESYENMEGNVYAQPRQDTLKHALSDNDNDYINPDAGQKPNLEKSDTESYENMDSLGYPDPAAQTSTDTADGGLYERMDRSWRRGGERARPRWTDRQETI